MQFCENCKHFMPFDGAVDKDADLSLAKCKASEKPKDNWGFISEKFLSRIEYLFCTTVRDSETCENYEEKETK